jgi:hypothetical protein
MGFGEFGAILVVVAVMAVAAYFIVNFGAGIGARWVTCPHCGAKANIAASWQTGDGVTHCEIVQCSLMPGGRPVTCDRACLIQL